ncbi:DUF4347 domain-containing protein [Thiomicrorhabdus sp. Milos-T2]|uniref:DUF4347 domain-containing protein n=1 Tax=Thiomicrorhabdus sp. Milos-T2 TaxID=90814 RepID=UPI000494D123|nr:DUF4347 domain-containing protein [Thiomicrorhabdus sp. Milos-T2]
MSIKRKNKDIKTASERKPKLQFEALEARILLSADLGVSAADLEGPSSPIENEVMTSEIHLDGFDSSEFEPNTIAVEDSLTRLAETIVSETSNAPEDYVDAQVLNETDEEADSVVMTPDAIYLAEKMMASEIVIVDAAIPDLPSVVNELFNADSSEEVLNQEDVTLTPPELPVTAVAESSEAPQLNNSFDLIGANFDRQLEINADREIKVFVLDSSKDGLEQISSILDYFQGVAAVHLLSHGSAGALFLGNTKVNAQQLRQNAEKLKLWGNSLTKDADLLLYGCDVANGELGLEFVEQLAVATGADIAASDDATGNLENADWKLEKNIGEIETTSFVSRALNGILATTPTDGNDTLAVTSGTIAGLKGNDSYTFSSMPSSTVTLKELNNEGTDTLNLSNVTNDLKIVIKKDNQVKVYVGTTLKITATYIENIIGGKGNDAFVVEKGASLKGYIDGGLGSNSLTYTDPNPGLFSNTTYTGSVITDFGNNADQDGKSTAIDGFAANGIKNIDSVTGGKGNDFIKGGTGIDDLSGGKGDDAITGNAGIDNIQGDAGNDWLDGGIGTDTVQGGAGEDTLIASVGGDTLSGGAGNDTYQFSDSFDWNATKVTELANQGADILDFGLVTADLTFTVNDLSTTGATISATGKTITAAKQIEKIVAGSAINTFNFQSNWSELLLIESTTAATINIDFSAVTEDLYFTIRADGSVKVTDSTSRNSGHSVIVDNVDKIIGGQGTNTFTLEQGTSYVGILTGGASTNILDYSQFGVAIDLIASTTVLPGFTAATTLTGTFDIVGSDRKDILVADASGQKLSGAKGDDFLIGAAGNDELLGNKGDDVFHGGAGNDSFVGGTGDDTYYFSNNWGQDTGITELAREGFDTISFAGMDQITPSPLSTINAFSGVTQDLNFVFDTGALDISQGSNSLNVTNTSLPYIENLLGGSGSNTYEFKNNWWQATGSVADDINLDDTASTNGTLDFSDVTSDLKFLVTDDNGVTVVTVSTIVAGKEYKVSARGIENLIGGKGDNQYLFEGNASLSGSLTGYSGTGANAGTATLNFSDFDDGSSHGVKVDLSTGVAKIIINPADATQDISFIGSFSNVNDLVGSDYADELTGDNKDNNLKGGDGADTLIGGSGVDTLTGGKGSDDLQGGVGNDVYVIEKQWSKLDIALPPTQADSITDASGANTLDLTAISKDLKVTFKDDATSGTNVTVSAVVGSLAGVDAKNKVSINQAGSDWIINTGSGDDTFIVTDGADFAGSFDAGDGINTLDYFNGTDSLHTDSYNQAVTVNLETGRATGFKAADDSVVGIRDVYGSGFGGADNLTGDNQDNTFYVGEWGEADGNANRSHTIVGGGGENTVSFTTFTASDFAFVADLSADLVTHEKADGTVQNVATIQDIANLIGGAGSDTLIGDALANILNGGAGDDTLQGGDGNDTYQFDSSFGLDSIVESLAEGKDVLDFTGVSEALTFKKGDTSSLTEIDLATALAQNVTVTDGTNTLTADFNVERFEGVKDTDTIEQVNVTVEVAVQDEMISGLETFKDFIDLLPDHGDFDGLLNLSVPLIGQNLGDLIDDGGVTATEFKDKVAAELEIRIDALKTLFWGETTEPAQGAKTDSNTDAILALVDGNGLPLFTIAENTRLLEFGTSIELFNQTTNQALDLGATLSEIPAVDVDLNLSVNGQMMLDFNFGVLPQDASQPTQNLEFNLADPSVNFNITVFDNDVNTTLDLGLIQAGVDSGELALNLALGLGAVTDLNQTTLQNVVDGNTAITGVFSLQADKSTAITAELPVNVNASGLGIDLPNLPVISLSTPELPEFPDLSALSSWLTDIDWSLPDLSEIFDLGNISIDQLFQMLTSGLQYLLDNFEFNLNIPGLGLDIDSLFSKLGELIPNFNGFDTGIEQFLQDLINALDPTAFTGGLDSLEVWLNDLISGLFPSIWPDISLPKFDLGWNGIDLGLDFNFDVGINDLLASFSLPELALAFDMDLSDLASYFDLPTNFLPGDLAIEFNAGAELAVDAGFDMDLELEFAAQEFTQAVIANMGLSGLDFMHYAFVGDDSQVSVDASASASDIDIEAILTIDDTLPDIGFWVEDGVAVISAGAGLTLAQTSSGRYQLSQFATPAANLFVIEAGGEATVDLPMYLGTGSLPIGGTTLDLNSDGIADNTLHAGFDFGTGGISSPEVIAPNFSSFNLIAFLNDPTTVLTGLEGMFSNIKSLMTDQLGQLGLPLVGDVMKNAGAFVDELRDNLLGVKNSGIYETGKLGAELTEAAANGDDVISLIRDALFNELGDYLQVVVSDSDGNPAFSDAGTPLYREVETSDDIGLVLTADGALTFNVLLAGSVFEGLDDYVERTADLDGDGELEVIKRFLEVPIDFDLTAPGLGLKTGPDDTIEVSLDYFFGLGFGFDMDGFFLDTAGVTQEGDELGLILEASLSSGASLTGVLGFLQMSLTEVADDDGSSGLRGKIAVDLKDGDNDDKWRIGEALGLAAGISAYANVDIFAEVDMDFAGKDISLPGMNTTIHYDQELANVTWESGATFAANFFEAPEVVLEDVTLNVGDLFSGFIGPVALELDPFLGKESEVRRVIDILTTPIDLGITELKLLDIVVLSMNLKSPGTGDALKKVVEALQGVSNFISLASNAAKSNTPIEVNFGTFDLKGGLVTSDSNTITQNSYEKKEGTGENSKDKVANSNATESQKTLTTQLTATGGDILFPILYDPMTAVGLLLGKDVDLFIYDTPDLQFNVEYEQSFPVFTGLNAVLKGSLEAYTDFFFGFDTTGIRSWFDSFESNDYDFLDSAGDLDDIFDGFFIADVDVDANGVLGTEDVSEVVLKVQIAAGAALGIGGLVEAGVLGGIESIIGLNLHDKPAPGTGGNTGIPAVYDGKIRFDEISQIIQHNPLCLFDMEGVINAFLEAYLWVGVKVFGSKITLFSASERFVEYEIASFEYVCPDPNPTVATLDNGVLTLAYRDDNGNAADFEKYKVYLDTVEYFDNAGKKTGEEERIFVTGNGHTQTWAKGDVSKIVSEGTSGNDVFEVDTEVNVDFDIGGGAGNDIIMFNGNQNSDRNRIIRGGEGNDTIVGSAISDRIYGDAGNDNIKSGDGVDIIYGGTGDDFIWVEGTEVATSGLANGFANYVDAGAGNDQILGGDGADKILGGTGDDTVDSGAGNDYIDGGDGADYIDAGEGADVILGGAGDDGLNWETGDGADNFTGGKGSDEIFMAGYQINPDEFYKEDSSNYIVDDGATDTIVVSDSNGNTNVSWQHGSGPTVTLTSSGVELLSMDSGDGADDISIGNLKDTDTANVSLSTGTVRSLKTVERSVQERDEDGNLVKSSQKLDFKILDSQDDGDIDNVTVEGTQGIDDYLISTVESTGIDGNTQTSLRYEQLDGGKDEAQKPTSHVIVDVYNLGTSDKTLLETLAGNDSIDAQGVTNALVAELFMDGGADDDTIIGTSLASTSDVIIGGSGSDRMTGAVGVDKFFEQSVIGDSNIAGDVDVLVEKRDADFTLKNQQLVIDDSNLSGQNGNETENFAQIFENAELTGLDSANKFEITDWSGGGILDGGKGGDSYTLELAQLAEGRQFLNIDDTGASGIDSLIYKGSTGDDTIQMDTVYKKEQDVENKFTDSRWTDYGEHGDGLLIAHFDSTDNFTEVNLDDEDALMNVKESGLSEGADYQVINYNSVEEVTVFGGEGNDKFISDGTASQVDVYGDAGDDQFYIGSVLKTDTVLVEGQEVTIVEEITDGVNFNGSAFFGGEDDDYFEVNHNAADIGLYGDNGDDTFFIKALLTLDDDGELLDIDSGVANVSGVSVNQNPNDTREVDVDTLVYVENANVTIDGGAGFDSVAIVGTVLSDTFYVFVERDETTGETIQRIYGAGIKLQKLLNIERLQLLTGGGDDTVFLYGVDMGLIGDMVVKTGSGSDTVHVGGPEQIINLNFPKNSDLFYSQVEGFKVDQDAEGNYLYAGMVAGLPFYRIDEVDRVVPFEVQNPARTLQITMPESYDINAFTSPVLIDGGEGVRDEIIFNNQQGANNIRFANTELERKEVVFDYSKFSLTSGSGDFVGTILNDPTSGSVAQELLGSAVGDYIRFQDRYYDTSLVDTLNANNLSQLVIPEGLSYFNIQNTLQSDGTLSFARDQLIDLATKFNLSLSWTIVNHPDPTRADPNGDGDYSDGEKLYELLSIKTADGETVAFEAQHKETVIFDISGNMSILKDLTALTLKTTSTLTVDFSDDAISSVELIRSDDMNTLGVIGAAPELHITGMNDITLNLSEKDQVNGSVLEVDNELFGTEKITDQTGQTQTLNTTDKLFVEGGSTADDIRIQQTLAEVIVHGNDGNDTITVGKDGRLDQIKDQVYLFGDAGEDSIILDREQDASDADVTMDKNLLEHSKGFEQLSRITSALSLQNITADENTLLEENLKEASDPYADAAFSVNQNDLRTAADEIAEDTLTKLLKVLENGKQQLADSTQNAVDTLRENDQMLLENQIKLYTRSKYYDDNNIDTAILNKLTSLGIFTSFSVEYKVDLFFLEHTFYENFDWRSIQNGFTIAEDWLSNFANKVDISDGDNSQTVTLDASSNKSFIQQLLEDNAGNSDLFGLINDAVTKNKQEVFTAEETESDWLTVTFSLDMYAYNHWTTDNAARAYANIYDDLVNDYLGTSGIYKSLLESRGLNNTEINNLYNQYSSNTAIRGFDISNPLAGDKAYYSPDLIESIDNINLDLSASTLSHTTQAVQNQLNDLNLNIQNSFADRYDDKFDSLISKINGVLNAGNFSEATLKSISNELESLVNSTNPYSGSSLQADQQMVLAPVYNLLAGNTENGLAEIISDVADLHTAINSADFNAIIAAAQATTNYSDDQALFSTANYALAQDAYSKASDIIDKFLIYSAGQVDMGELSPETIEVLKQIKILDRAATRFDAFVDALETGFDFNAFKSDYLANQQEVQTFIANHPEYVAYLQSESRFEAMAGSLTQDSRDTITLSALNQQQYNLLTSAYQDAIAKRNWLINGGTYNGEYYQGLKNEYTVHINYWWFWGEYRTIQLDYTVDQRFTQANALVSELANQLNQAYGFKVESDSQTARLNSLLTGYSGEETTLEGKIADLGTQYETAKDELNAQYLVLKELSKFAVEVIKARGPDQDIEGFADDSSLISEMVSFYDDYNIIDENASQLPYETNQFLSEVRDEQGELIRGTTQSSVIFKEDNREYTDITSVSGLTEQGADIHVGYDDVEMLTVKTGSGNDQVQVMDTLGQLTAEVHIETNGGNDLVTVTDENNTTEGVTSQLIVDSGLGINRLEINDIADSSGDTITMTNSERAGYTSVTGIAAGDIHYAGAYGDGVLLQAGLGADDITVDGVIEYAHTTIKAGKGDDDVTVTVNNVRSSIETKLTIQGENGEDIIDAIDSGFGITIEGNLGNDTIYGSMHDDLISGNQDNDFIVGGLGSDEIFGNAGEDIILGDLGSITDENGNEMTQRAGILTRVESTIGGDNDTIDGGLGNDTIIASGGDDKVTDSGGNNTIFGDHGLVTYLAGMTAAVTSRHIQEGGNDNVTASDGDNLIIGGYGNDTVAAGNGNNRVLGDNGEMLFTDGILQTITTYDTDSLTGGVDKVTLGNGKHIVIAGTHGDTINSGIGNSILMGDNGTATFTLSGERTQVVSEVSTLGGDDRITAAGGDNLVLGGVGNDNINTGAGADSIFGDNGQLEYLDGILNRTETTDVSESTGGIDTIESGDGNNTVFGGSYGDTITSGVGNSILAGDNGFVQLNDTGDQRVEVRSELSTLGGDDGISARGGNNLAFGSVGNDLIETADGDDVIFGDNGVALYKNGLADVYTTTDLTLATSGNDNLIGGAGDDLIFGGLGNEVIYADAGDDKVLGDLGTANYNTDDSNPLTLDRVFSENSEIGGQDEIHGGDDNDIIIGGANDDNLFGDKGDDFVSGDGGQAIFKNAQLESVETIELFIGGDDQLSGGADNDVLMGGFGDDLFFGNLSEDAMIGEYARALIDSSQAGFENGVFVVRLAQGNLDLIASNQFGLYNDKLEGLGFTPLSKFTPLSSSGLKADAATSLFTSDGERRHYSGVAQDNIIDILNNLPATGSGGDENTDDEDNQCYDDQGEVVECPIEEQGTPESGQEDAQPEIDQDGNIEGKPESVQPVKEEPAVDPQQNSQEDKDNNPQDNSSEEGSDVVAAVSAMAGWALATGNTSGNIKVAKKGFDKLSHQQRKLMRWDDQNQCFVKDSK